MTVITGEQLWQIKMAYPENPAIQSLIDSHESLRAERDGLAEKVWSLEQEIKQIEIDMRSRHRYLDEG
jgi:hypothetical protein